MINSWNSFFWWSFSRNSISSIHDVFFWCILFFWISSYPLLEGSRHLQSCKKCRLFFKIVSNYVQMVLFQCIFYWNFLVQISMSRRTGSLSEQSQPFPKITSLPLFQFWRFENRVASFYRVIILSNKELLFSWQLWFDYLALLINHATCFIFAGYFFLDFFDGIHLLIYQNMFFVIFMKIATISPKKTEWKIAGAWCAYIFLSFS